MADNPLPIEAEQQVEPKDAENRITFRYVKSPLYRETYSTGAYGALTPNGDIRICFYSQHVPDPSLQVFSLNDDGTLAKMIKVEPADGHLIVREVEVGVTIDLSTAVALIKWLQGQIAQVQSQTGTEPIETPKSANGTENVEAI